MMSLSNEGFTLFEHEQNGFNHLKEELITKG